MRSRILATVAAVAAGVALTVGAAGVAGSALGGSDGSSTTHEAAKIMVIKVPGSPATVIGTPGGN